MGEQPAASTIVIFGASGDLAQRKLVPALHSLACDGLLPGRGAHRGRCQVGVTDEGFREHLYRGTRLTHGVSPGRVSCGPDYPRRIRILRADTTTRIPTKGCARRWRPWTLRREGRAIPSSIWPFLPRCTGQLSMLSALQA